jgi:thiol-disulfide isomerase/thioredoxin
MRTVIFVLLLAIVALLVYRVWEPFVSSKPAKQVVPPRQANLYFFYTDWCGWSQKAQPEIKKLEETLSAGGKFGNTKVTLVPVDAEEDREKAELYEVKGYPTILLENADGIRDYNQGVTYENLIGFLRKALGEESIDAAKPATE